MTTPKKFILAGVLLASVSALAIPTFAAQYQGDPAADQSQATGASSGKQQLAFGGDWDRGGPRQGHGGPGGPGGFHRGEFMFDRMVELLGLNDDGKLTPAQIEAAVDAKFKSYDKNGDSKITLDEYQAFWLDLTHERMVRSFQRLDREGAGAVTMDEIAKPLDRVLARLDRNGDGVINQADFQHRHRGWGGPGNPGGGPQGPGGPGAPPSPPAQ